MMHAKRIHCFDDVESAEWRQALAAKDHK